jgi:hypothetical protein
MESVSETTRKAYDGMWAWVEREGLDANEPEEVVKHIKATWANVKTQKTKLALLIGFLRKSPFENPAALERYTTEMSRYMTELKKTEGKQEATEKEEDNWLSWPQVMEASKTIQGRFVDGLKQLEDAILISLHTDMLVVRNDYAGLGFSDASPNWLNLKTGQITIRAHKTAATFGSLNRQCPMHTLALIHLLLAKSPRDILFKESENKLSARLISLFEKQTGKRIGTTMLRHIWTTHNQKGEQTLAERQETAKNMGHSMTMNMEYRRPELE